MHVHRALDTYTPSSQKGKGPAHFAPLYLSWLADEKSDEILKFSIDASSFSIILKSCLWLLLTMARFFPPWKNSFSASILTPAQKDTRWSQLDQRNQILASREKSCCAATGEVAIEYLEAEIDVIPILESSIVSSRSRRCETEWMEPDYWK